MISGTPPAGFDSKRFLKTVTRRPGVYRMLDAQGQIIYVGKARNLKNRLASYFRTTWQSPKTQVMVEQIDAIEVTITATEGEALLLENNLIKEFKPRYNILLRDDKSYPYIHLSAHPDFPRMGFYRGARREAGRFFGPYPSASAVRESLQLLQKIFPVRQCEDSFFRNRSRPCLQYQIKRCSAPCVDLISKEVYQEDVRHAVMFLEGKNQQVIDELVRRMEAAAVRLHYEEAARYRDQIATLRRIQEHQCMSGEGGDLDVLAAAVRAGVGCVTVFYVRGGRVLGDKSFFPRHTEDCAASDVLAAFLPQYYLGREAPPEILVNESLDDGGLLEQVLAQQTGRRVTIVQRVRGERARWVRLAVTNAENALSQRLSNKANMAQRFEALQEALGLESLPQRMECFDISHTRGEAAVAACVVFDVEGPVKADYRRFNVENITPGDDYAAMRQALTRRYTRLKEGEGVWPDILFIDGGRGQIAQAESVLEELQISGITVVGVAKGQGRKAGLESLFLPGDTSPLILPGGAAALHLVQQIRDEAHRFAITGHRQRRGKIRTVSPLEQIPGLGPRRRRALLTQFGGLQEVARAGIADLVKVQGISKELAQRIYDVLHGDGR